MKGEGMSFASRVVRMSKGAVALTAAESKGDSAVIAFENLELFSKAEEKVIGAPRASSLYESCVRMLVIGTKNRVVRKSWDSLNDRMIFLIGHAVHYWAQNTPDLFGNRRRGWWRCSACGAIRQFGPPPTTKCEKCGARPEASIYAEHYFKLKDPFYVTGHSDMFIEKKKALFRVVELKTISGDAFSKLRAPLVQHEWQVLTYLLGVAHDKTLPVSIDSRAGYIVYISKKFTTKEAPVKMFLIKKNPLIQQKIKEKLMLYKNAIDGGPLPPPKPSCLQSKFGNYEAKFCPVRKQCIEDWVKNGGGKI